jgi:uncharacterized RDD family membrane protein YckC
VKQNPQTVTIETPEHIELQFLLAGIGSRFLAYFVDRCIQPCLILGLILSILLMVFALGRVAPVVESLQGMAKFLGRWLIALGILAYGLISIGYFILFEYLWNGATPGKRSQHIRVIRADGRPLSFFDAAVRNILRFLDILGDVYPVGLVVMLVDQRHRRFGDLTAGTLVVVERPAETPPVRDQPSIDQGAAPELRWIAAHMQQEDYQLVAKFLSRRDGLEVPHRQALAWGICDRLHLGAGKTPAPVPSPEDVLEAVETLYREKTRIL